MKSRLTITLSEDILKKVDATIDGKNIRNRSHAIEHLVNQSLSPSINTAVILAGGKRGVKTPPALTCINNHLLVSITIDHLKAHGIKNIIICGGSHTNKIKKELGSGEKLGVTITYIPESKKLGTAGAIKKTQEYTNNDPFLVIYGDVLTNVNLTDFIAFHQEEGTIATIAVKPRLAEKSYGKVLLQGNRITSFLGKGEAKGISMINTGVYLLDPKVYSLIPNKTPSSIGEDVFPKLAKMGELSAFLFQGIWFDISNNKDKKQASLRWQQINKRG